MISKNITILVFLAFFTLSVFAQKVKPLNLPSYDHEKLHFGFSLGVNKADFIIITQSYPNKPDSVLSINGVPDWGFNLGIISDLRLHDYVTLRFLPALSFQTRNIEYQILPTSSVNPGKFITETKKVESTLLDFPIDLKIRSERLNNMSAYLLAGGKFSIDLASQAKTKKPDVVKLNTKDYCFEAGVGLDFYLTYFKLSAEMKFDVGLKDRLYHENTTYSSPINKLFSKTWLFSLNFEG